MTGLVQEVSGSSATSSLTLNFPSNTTAGNGVIIAACGFNGGSISGITLGGTGSLFSEQAGDSTDNAQIWLCPYTSITSKTIVITASVAGIIAWAYEVNGYAVSVGGAAITKDKSASAHGSNQTSWASGATGSTIPLAEFVVGVGATYSSGVVTVNGPAGWTNESPFNNVATGGGQVAGGISGYKTQGSSSTTYNYSGTASGNANWGAAVAAFLLMPSNGGGWGGYVFKEHSSYTGVSATFTIPALSGEAGALSTIWVGLGNVYQTGIYISYDTGSSGDDACRPWSWWLPGAGEDWKQASYPTASGDSLTLTMNLNATGWLMTITNHTQSWTFTEVKSILAVNVGSLRNPSGPGFWPYPCSQAEVIIEDEGTNADYGTVTFTSITTTPAAVATPQPLASAPSGTITQYPGPYSNASFTMNWNAF